ncbi:unnamed protein product, partial [Pylaiella littoralis]
MKGRRSNGDDGIGCSSWLQVQKADMDAEPTGSECAKCL